MHAIAWSLSANTKTQQLVSKALFVRQQGKFCFQRQDFYMHVYTIEYSAWIPTLNKKLGNLCPELEEWSVTLERVDLQRKKQQGQKTKLGTPVTHMLSIILLSIKMTTYFNSHLMRVNR